MKTYDFLVIGGGSAGYAAARTAVGHGLSTAVVDGADELGGLCILRGCMPSKAVIESANRNLTLRRADEFGLRTGQTAVHAKEIQARKRALIADFASYRQEQLEDGRFDLVRGHATFTDANTVSITLRDGGGKEVIGFRSALISTGSKVTRVPITGLEEAGYLTSDDILDLESLPESIIVLGGGAIALEAAHHLEGLGTKVTVIQRSDHLLSGLDHDIADAIQETLAKRDITFFTGTKITGVSKTDTGKAIEFEHQGKTRQAKAAEILLTLGRSPAVGTLGLTDAGVALEKARVWTSDDQSTSVPHIFAAGDVCGQVDVVHIAIQQGEVAATNAAIKLGKIPETARKKMDYRLKILGIFTQPQIASVGLTEIEATAQNIPFRTASYPFDDHGKSMVMGETEGFVKLIAEEESGEIIGAAAVGPEVVELIHEIVVAMHFRATAADLATVPHYHPTLSEIWLYPAENLSEH